MLKCLFLSIQVTRVVLLWVHNHFTDFETDVRMMDFLEQFEFKLEREVSTISNCFFMHERFLVCVSWHLFTKHCSLTIQLDPYTYPIDPYTCPITYNHNIFLYTPNFSFEWGNLVRYLKHPKIEAIVTNICPNLFCGHLKYKGYVS